MLDNERISDLERYLADWRDWKNLAVDERDRLLKLLSLHSRLASGDTATGELLQRRIDSFDTAAREYDAAELRITHALNVARNEQR